MKNQGPFLLKTDTQASSNATINQVTTAYQDISNTFDPGGRIGQLMFRVNW